VGKLKGGDSLNMKIVLLTLLVTFAAIAISAYAFVAYDISASVSDDTIDRGSYNVYDEVAPMGDDKGGGWGILDKT
jgi:hypothetical protein